MIRLAAMAVAVGAFALPAAAQTQRSDTASAAQAIAIAGGGGGAAQRTQRVVTVPGVVPPSFYGANPCSNSASVGGAVMGFGFGGGGQWTERECRDQEWFRFLHMAGDGDVARAFVCARYDDLRAAYRAAGRPCPQDVAAPVAQAPAPPAAPSRARPAYCRPGIANSECG